eukprot:scaffold1726_cov260-Pinguiococcus_pyrenoidosus.AAC.4
MTRRDSWVGASGTASARSVPMASPLATRSRKDLKILSPVAELFSGWNCVATMFPYCTAEMNSSLP